MMGRFDICGFGIFVFILILILIFICILYIENKFQSVIFSQVNVITLTITLIWFGCELEKISR